MDILLPPDWPRPSGYSNGIAVEGRLIFVAGQIGWDRNQKLGSVRLVDQVRQALLNIVAILQEAGADASHIVRMTWYITNKNDYLTHRGEIGKVYQEVMGKHYPTMSLLIVNDLLETGAKVEIEATAVIPYET